MSKNQAKVKQICSTQINLFIHDIHICNFYSVRATASIFLFYFIFIILFYFYYLWACYSKYLDAMKRDFIAVTLVNSVVVKTV